MSFVRSLDIHRYDPTNPTHRQLAALSQAAHAATAAGDVVRVREIEAEIDRLARDSGEPGGTGVTERECVDIFTGGRMSQILTSPQLSDLISKPSQVLLVNSNAVDIRLPWARWMQPTGLLQIGAALRAQGCDVRLIDCLYMPVGGRLARERVGRIAIPSDQSDGYGRTIDVWRFGLPPAKVAARVRKWREEGWQPDAILVSCGLPAWWQGARDVIAALKEGAQRQGVGAQRRCTPTVPVILGGCYPTFYPEHALAHTAADIVVAGDLAEAQSMTPDLALYRPDAVARFAGIHLFHPAGVLGTDKTARAPLAIAEEVAAKARLGVTAAALFDDWLGPDEAAPLARALQAIAALNLRGVRFVGIGNLSPRAVDRPLARWLRRAGFRQVTLHDDVLHGPNGIQRLTSLDEVARCVQALHEAGFRPRTDEIGAAVLIGMPGEDLEALAEYLAHLASIVGSVHLVPYQYTPGTPDPSTELTDPQSFNAQLYPLARLAGARLEDYWELHRLAALLNSKFHSTSFDFLGNGLTARLVRTSLRQQLWNPFPPGPAEQIPIPLITEMEKR